MVDTTFLPAGLYPHTFTRVATGYTCDGCDITVPLAESTSHRLVFMVMGDPHNARNMDLLRRHLSDPPPVP